jgi:hypothetical protein
MQPDPNARSDLRELGYAEHLIIWAFRALSVGRDGCPMIEREFRKAFGPAAEEVRGALRFLALGIQRGGRRPVVLSEPGLLSLTRDEQLLLAIYAAAQAGERERCRAHLTWLLGATPAETLYNLAFVAARTIGAHGYRLHAVTDRSGETTMRMAQGGR